MNYTNNKIERREIEKNPLVPRHHRCGGWVLGMVVVVAAVRPGIVYVPRHCRRGSWVLARVVVVAAIRVICLVVN